MNKITFNSFIGKNQKIEIGSTAITRVWDADDLLKMLKSVIKHNLFDIDFYYNGTQNGGEYVTIFTEDTLNVMVENIDETLAKYFSLRKTPYSINEDVLLFEDMDTTTFIDNWFKTNKRISEELRNEYRIYRKEYSGVDI